MTAARKILRLLKELRLEQKSTAKTVRVAYRTFRCYIRESNPSVPSVDIALRIARALNVPIAWLYDDDQDWPPPLPPTMANLGQRELVAELARRRELLRKDMRKTAADFPGDRMVHINRLCRLERLSDSQECELQAALAGLLGYSFHETMLEWLDPDAVHPTAKLDKMERLLDGYTHISAALNSVRDENRTSRMPSPLALQRITKGSEVPNYDRDGGTFPRKPRPYPLVRSRSTPKPRSAGDKPTATKPKKPKPRTTGKKSAPAKPQRPKRPPRS